MGRVSEFVYLDDKQTDLAFVFTPVFPGVFSFYSIG